MIVGEGSDNIIFETLVLFFGDIWPLDSLVYGMRGIGSPKRLLEDILITVPLANESLIVFGKS